MQINVSYFT